MIDPNDVALIQKEVAQTFGDPVGLKDEEGLRQALSRPFATKSGIPAYPTYFNKLSILFREIVENRPFFGANRRTALTVMGYLLDVRGYKLNASVDDFKGLLIGVEAGYTTWHRITVWIKRHAVRIGPRTGHHA